MSDYEKDEYLKEEYLQEAEDLLDIYNKMIESDPSQL
mgnify:CR=1 FL=1